MCTRIWARKYAPFIASAWVRSFLSSTSIAQCPNKLFLPEGHLYAIYFGSDEWGGVVKNYTNFLLGANMEEYSGVYEKVFQDFFHWSVEVNQRDFGRASNEDLILLLRTLHTKLIDFGEWQLLSFVVLEGPGKRLEKLLENNPQKSAILEWVSTPYRTTVITQARLELLDLGVPGTVSPYDLTEYIKKYAWIPLYEFVDTPWTVQNIQKQIIGIKNPAAEKIQIEKRVRQNLAQFETYYQAQDEGEFKKLLNIVHIFSYLKEMRDDYRRHAYFYFIPFWQEVGKRLALSLEQTNYLLLDEIEEALNKDANSYRELIAERMKEFSFVLTDGTLEIFAVDKTAEFLSSSTFETNTLEGVAAAPGIVRGRVRIIYHQGEFHKFQPGEILVTTMTHPEFLPLMKTAAAIITDEGGVTCHAAIVARELGKPCVIATIQATRILKDGDLVEVNGDMGRATKL